ncbi:FkbM family methyltransferase [Roseibium aggregatum]|uniref:FkbM family methyltransferase n=1 Tax=Roseibium aggregatum TaxID=187304 RepID=A0A939EFB3_9HYPH|nr:FkbM family methyltransferase [Roseibium aggregatum]MBN9672110.1 FkbM family methyltransferase [Roseibium aggregatum]
MATHLSFPEASPEDLNPLRTRLSADLDKVFGPPRGRLMHDLWSVEKALGLHRDYFSQSGQDRFLHEEIFKGKYKGTFVDIGGYDGITGSNTLFFEQHLGWTGLLVEPASSPFETASRTRRCACRQCAVGRAPAEATFIEVFDGYTQMSGLAESYEQTMLETVRQNPAHRERRVPVPVRPIRDLLEEANIKRIDYLSLDIEGGEWAVLETFPFDTIRVEAWSIENNTDTPDIARFMAGKGYEVIEFIGRDEIYRSV